MKMGCPLKSEPGVVTFTVTFAFSPFWPVVLSTVAVSVPLLYCPRKSWLPRIGLVVER